MRTHSKARSSAFAATVALSAAGAALMAIVTPATAEAARPAVISPKACTISSYVDRDEHTGHVFAVGYATCPVNSPASISAGLYIDGALVKQSGQGCPLGSDCYTSSGAIALHSGRHQYCARAALFLSGGLGSTPSKVVWSCEYLG